jgi:replicative DNA helicase
MTSPAIYPEQDERDLIGCLIASRRGARLGRERCRPHEFYNPRHQRLAEAALRLPDTLTGADEDSLAERVRLAAGWAGVPAAEVADILTDRRVHADVSGAVAAAVTRAARRRSLITATARAHAALVDGAPLPDALAELTELGVAA